MAVNIFQRRSFAGAILTSGTTRVAQGCLVQACSPSCLAWESHAVEAPLLMGSIVLVKGNTA